MRFLTKHHADDQTTPERLTQAQSDKLRDELEAISSVPKDEPHIEFRLAFDAIRRRQMREFGEGAEPPVEDAIDEAVELVRIDFEGFQPQIGAAEKESPSALKSDAVRQMLDCLADYDPTDATRLKWMLMPEATKQGLRERYERDWDGGDVQDVSLRFRDDVNAIHVKRAPQQEQYRELGRDAVE